MDETNKEQTSKEIIDAINKVNELISKSIESANLETADTEEIKLLRKKIEESHKEIESSLQAVLHGVKELFPQEKEPENEYTKEFPGLYKSAHKARIYGDLFPYMETILEENPDIGQEPINVLIAQAAARARKDGLKIPELEAEKAILPQSVFQGTNKIIWPVNQINNELWRQFDRSVRTQIDGQLTMDFDITFIISFEELEKLNLSFSRTLSEYEKRVYMVAGNLWNMGNEYITATQIYEHMKDKTKKKPSEKDIEKIDSVVTKMLRTMIYIDNVAESSKYDRFRYDGSLFPCERVTAIINNKPCEAAIHLFREPPLLSYAKAKKQITTFSQKLFGSPLSMTEANFTLEHYLIEQISRITRNQDSSNRLKFTTIYSNCKVDSSMKKKRTREKIKVLLDFYKNDVSFISDYSIDGDGITIIPKRNRIESQN